MWVKYAGLEKEVKPSVVGRNTHAVWVILGTVNNGRKKSVAGILGTQSTLTLLPVNGASEEENALIVGAISIIETMLSSNVTKASALTGSNIFIAHTKLLPGSRNFSRTIGSFIDGKVQAETLNVALADNTAES